MSLPFSSSLRIAGTSALRRGAIRDAFQSVRAFKRATNTRKVSTRAAVNTPVWSGGRVVLLATFAAAIAYTAGSIEGRMNNTPSPVSRRPTHNYANVKDMENVWSTSMASPPLTHAGSRRTPQPLRRRRHQHRRRRPPPSRVLRMVLVQPRPTSRRRRVPQIHRRCLTTREGLQQVPHPHDPLLGRHEPRGQLLRAVWRHEHRLRLHG